MGASAGTHIATSSIEHVKHFDSNDIGIRDFKGLNFYNGIILCHYSKERECIYKKLASAKNLKIETLTNEEIIFFSKGLWRKI